MRVRHWRGGTMQEIILLRALSLLCYTVSPLTLLDLPDAPHLRSPRYRTAFSSREMTCALVVVLRASCQHEPHLSHSIAPAAAAAAAGCSASLNSATARWGCSVQGDMCIQLKGAFDGPRAPRAPCAPHAPRGPHGRARARAGAGAGAGQGRAGRAG